MLSRAPRLNLRRDAHQNLQACIEQIQLPWLCPSLFRVLCQSRKASTIAKNSGQRYVQRNGRRSASVKRVTPFRGLASAAAVAHDVPEDHYVPFEGQKNPSEASINSQTPWSTGRSLSGLKDFNPLSPIIINDSLTSIHPRFRNFNGIGGPLTELRLTLHACLRVGRLDRAAAMVRRLNRLYEPQDPALLEAHNDYLRSVVEQVITTKDQQTLKKLQKWFEVDMKAGGVTPDATTYALMIKAAFQEANSARADRTIRRYVYLAKKHGVRNEVFSLPILSDQEFGKVTQIAPMDVDEAHEDILDSQSQEPKVLPTLSKGDIALPAVLPVDQKGLGLDALKKSLSLFSDTSNIPYPDHLQGTQEEKDQAYAAIRQQRLEEDTLKSAIERWREENIQLKKLGLNTALEQQSVGAMMWTWYEALVPLIREEISKANESEEEKKLSEEDKERYAYGPFLQVLPPEKLAAITILSCISSLSTYGIERGVRTGQLVQRVGNAVQDEALAEAIKGQSLPQTSSSASPDQRQYKYAAILKKRQTFESRMRLSRYFKAFNEYEERQLWSATIMAKVGAVLLSQLMQAAKIRVTQKQPGSDTVLYSDQPVFFHTYQFSSGKRVGLIRLNTAMGKILSMEPVAPALAKHLPMVSEPVPWKGTKKGGFLYHNVEVVRLLPGHNQVRNYANAAAERGDLDQIFAGLDVLGKTPWIINRSVFDVMLEAWNSGEAVANIAPLNPEINYPPQPAASEDASLRWAWTNMMRKLENDRAATHSQRCFQNFQLEIARAYLKEKFYFPHNIDFRGRAYPIPPYLNHMGADNCRGLLMFAKGKELGTAGLTWLKVHLANVFGFDKASLDERQSFTMDHLSDVYDSAKDPLKGKKWWLTAEDPWQTLAACIELRNALELPDPTRYVSHLPIHQDGTCNGLQHYAALGGDVIGAKQVNLEPGDRPSDIYTAVAEMVKAEITVEAAQGNKLAKMLEGKVTRKIVKPTVMTNVYGVTFAGAQAQVRRQLEAHYPDFADTPRMHLDTSAYVARKIFKALSTMFNGAHDIQYWLGNCATRIAESLTPEQMDIVENETLHNEATAAIRTRKLRGTNGKKIKDAQLAFKSSVIWTTPLKMPVVQPYRKTLTRIITTSLQKISIAQQLGSDPIHKRKQLQGFPPNFIHSLDATHMLLSALKCDEMGLTFAAVHDSFWTHAGDLEAMNRILRDAFIRMHSEDIIGRLAAEFSARHKGCMYLASVPARSSVGRRIIALRRSLKRENRISRQNGRVAELMLERRRLRLLASENPAERMEGEAMITPAKVFTETADEDLLPLEEPEYVGIGRLLPTRVAKLQADEQLDVGDIGNIDTIDTMEPFRDGGAAFTEDETDLDDEQADIEEDPEARVKKEKKEIARRKARDAQKTWLWLPLTFPPVPKKGDFDVSRLKDSQYFFS